MGKLETGACPKPEYGFALLFAFTALPLVAVFQFRLREHAGNDTGCNRDTGPERTYHDKCKQYDPKQREHKNRHFAKHDKKCENHKDRNQHGIHPGNYPYCFMFGNVRHPRVHVHHFPGGYVADHIGRIIEHTAGNVKHNC